MARIGHVHGVVSQDSRPKSSHWFPGSRQTTGPKAAGNPTHTVSQLIFNDRLDAAVTAVLVILVALILIESTALWDQNPLGPHGEQARKKPPS